MIKRTAWFDRGFSFDLPASMYPNVVERLRGTPYRLEDRVQSTPGKILTMREGGAWSIQENAGHLSDVEPLWIGRLDDLLSGMKVLRAADLENRRTHEADHNGGSIDDILAEFRRLRFRLVERLDELDEASVDRSAMHPRLNKPMRVLDLIFFIAEHDDHHLARITELMRILA